MTDKIQFACPQCSSTLAVAVTHAGKTAKCPVCSAAVMVPALGGVVDEGFALTAPASVPPRTSSSPFGSEGAESASSPGGSLFEELDSFGAASGKSLPSAGSALERAQRGGAPAEEGAYSFQPDPPGATSMGRSIGGLVAAMGVGLGAMIAWLVLAAMSGYELGILAWAIGGLIGFVAGVVAKNPSPVYCSMVALIAVGAILSAKLVMAIAIVAVHFGLTAMEDLSTLLVTDKYAHAYVDQALADNVFTDDKRQLAVDFNAGYFEPVDEEELTAEEDEELGAANEWNDEPEKPGMRDFQREIREKILAATDQEKAAWLANARQRHPSWIEDYNHYQAAVIELAAQPEQLDPELTAHAQYVLSSVINETGEFNGTYADSITPAEYNRRDRQLDLKCAEFLRGKSSAEMETLLRACMQKYPAFNPFADAFTATLDKMVQDGSLDASLQAHATMYLHTEFGPAEEMRYYEAERTPEFLASDKAMRQAVNARLVTMDENARKAAISATKVRHPDWLTYEVDEEMPDTEELKKDLGDGTFAGSLKMVFGIYDLLWLFLGATTAYGTALRRGKKS